MNEHVLDDLEAYALGSLDREAAERVASHLAICPACLREASALAEVVATLPDTVSSREPPGALRDRVLAAARADISAPAPSPWAWSLGRVRPARVLVAALAATLLLLAAVDLDAYHRVSSVSAERDSLYAIVEGLRQGGRLWYMAGKGTFVGSGGTLVDPRADSQQPFVLFHDLPAIPQGKVLTVWLVSADSTWARAATFRPDGRDVQAVHINVEVSGFDRCAVTLDDAPWGAHGAIVMESRIAPSTGG